MDHEATAERLLSFAESMVMGDAGLAVQAATAHALLALVGTLNDLSVLVAIPQE